MSRQTTPAAISRIAESAQSLSASSAVASEAARGCLRLHLVEGLGPILIARLLERFGSAEAILSATRIELEGVRGIGALLADRIRASTPDEAAAELDRAAAAGVRILCVADSEYPVPLRTLPDAPVCLYIRGALQPTDAVALAIVGARRCTLYAAEQSERFAAAAAEAGLTVVSGMAIGVDTAAHRGALRAKERTIAVLGCGLGFAQPQHVAELADAIAGSGAVLSEFPMLVPPAEQNFPRRNRIIAGLSLGTLIVEASHRSGALITARLANDYNREVFALPGRIDSNHARGCHDLIRRGEARLVTNIMDVLDELGEVGRTLAVGLRHGEPVIDPNDAAGRFDQPPRPVRREPDADSASSAAAVRPPLEPGESELLELMDEDEPASFELLIARTTLGAARVAATLTTLQLKGLVTRDTAGQFVRRG